MIKVLSAKQIRELDRYTISQEPVSSIDLMERACRAFVSWFIVHFNESKKIGIVCGTGNNGGDGLGIARLLLERGYTVKVWVVRGSVPETEDFKINLNRLLAKIEVTDISSEADQGLFVGIDVLLDGVFGSGLSRPPEGIYAQVIRCLNKSEAIKVAIDIPSGLMADSPSTGDIVEAHFTVTFQLPKLAFFFPQSFRYTGNWEAVDIGLKKNFIREAQTNFFFLTEKDVCRLIKPRTKFDHKGSFGHALIIAGSYGKMGAAVLASRAALRAGAGLLSVHIPKCGYSILQSTVPEAMVETDYNENYFTSCGNLEKINAAGIGPGLDQHSQTVQGMENFLTKFRKPIVIDADALNILSQNTRLLQLIPEGSILTPHPKEFERLTGNWKDDFRKTELLLNLSAKLRSVIVLKGAYSATATPEGKVYFNSTGNPGMATGGTGDVLTGILTGLLAQSYSATEAAILGVYLHGLAGDLVARERGMRGIIASDLIEFLPNAYKKLIRG